MRNKLWALQHRVELVAIDTERFEKSLTAFHKIFSMVEGQFAYGLFLPCYQTTLGDNLCSFVASTPLINPAKANDSPPIPIPSHLDPDGVLRDFISRDTHLYTEDNHITIVEDDVTR